MKFFALLIALTSALSIGDDCYATQNQCGSSKCCGYATPVQGGLTVRKCNKTGSTTFTDPKTKENYIYQCKATISHRTAAKKTEAGSAGLVAGGASVALMMATLF